jgi:hypothetical protein
MDSFIFAVWIIVIIIILSLTYKYYYVENMASTGGALIQLAAKGPMDQYLIGNEADKYMSWPYMYYSVRPKRAKRFYPYYYPLYYPWFTPYYDTPYA